MARARPVGLGRTAQSLAGFGKTHTTGPNSARSDGTMSHRGAAFWRFRARGCNDGGMTRLALLLLVLTSLAPIGLVQAAVLCGDKKWLQGAWFLGVALVLAITCLALLAGVQARKPARRMEFKDLASKESEPLAFLVAYALPLVAAPKGSIAGLVVFGILMGVVMWQQQIFHVNPLLAATGYHFFSAKNDSGGPVLLLTREKAPREGILSVVKLSDYLWLQCGIVPAGGADGSDTRHSEGPISPAAGA